MGNSYSSDGLAIIFNHENFDQNVTGENQPRRSLTPRTSSTHDVKNLEKLILDLGFPKPIIYKDKTTSKVKDIMQQLSRNETISCLLVFVLSHGESRGVIHSSDSTYLTKDIWDPFESGKAFEGKPKFFFFQACRGNTVELVVDREQKKKVDTDQEKKDDEEMKVYEQSTDTEPCYLLPILPKYSDCFIGYSTFEHTISNRWEECEKGSIYITTICEVFNTLNNANKVELLQFMTTVTNHVVDKINEQPFSSNEVKPVRQTPTFISLQDKPFYISNMRNRTTLQGTPTSGDTHQSSSKPSKKVVKTVASQPATVKHYLLKYNNDDHPYIGRCIIFHDAEYIHSTSARQFKEVLEICLPYFKITLIQLSSNSQSQLHQVTSEIDCSCLIVAVFARMEYNQRLELEQRIFYVQERAFYPCKFMWSPFTASRCKYLIDKPKLFFFVDNILDYRYFTIEYMLQHSQSSYRQIRNNSSITTDEDSRVTEHSDIVLVHVHSHGFFRSLKRELRLGIANGTDILVILTNAMQRYPLDSDIPRVPHFESTLRKQLVFKTKDEMAIEKKEGIVTTADVSRINNTIYYIQANLTSTYKKSSKSNRNIGGCKELSKSFKKKMIEENKKVKENVLVEEEKIKEIRKETNKLEYEVLKYRQEERNYDLIIENIPESYTGNLEDIVKKICACIKIEKEFDVWMIKKISKQSKKIKEDTTLSFSSNTALSTAATGVSSGSGTAHRLTRKRKINKSVRLLPTTIKNSTRNSFNIHVEFESDKVRNKIINLSRKYKIKGSDIGINSESRIYVNAYLNKENLHLFYYAKKKLQKSSGPNFKYVWYNPNGKILARKNLSSKIYVIKSCLLVDIIEKYPESFI